MVCVCVRMYVTQRGEVAVVVTHRFVVSDRTSLNGLFFETGGKFCGFVLHVVSSGVSTNWYSEMVPAGVQFCDWQTCNANKINIQNHRLRVGNMRVHGSICMLIEQRNTSNRALSSPYQYFSWKTQIFGSFNQVICSFRKILKTWYFCMGTHSGCVSEPCAQCGLCCRIHSNPRNHPCAYISISQVCVHTIHASSVRQNEHFPMIFRNTKLKCMHVRWHPPYSRRKSRVVYSSRARFVSVLPRSGSIDEVNMGEVVSKVCFIRILWGNKSVQTSTKVASLFYDGGKLPPHYF